MTNVFFTLPLSKFYLINNCIHFIHFVCALCVFVEWGDRGRPVGAGKAYGWGQAQQCSMFYNTPCVQFSWAVMFSVAQEELFPMTMDETLGY